MYKYLDSYLDLTSSPPPPTPHCPQMFQDLFSGYELPTQQLESPAFQAIEDRLRIEASQVDLLTVGKG